MKNIAIIPARSGSKGLSDKNIKILNDKPLLAYTIEAAVACLRFDAVMVSTDSEVYAEIARRYGAEVPFLRSRKTSSDEASSWDTVLEVLDEYEKRGQVFDTFCLLQPTSPMRTAEDIISAYDVFNEKDASAVVSMVEVDHALSWCGVIGTDGSIEDFISRDSSGRRQSQPVYYRPNGAIFVQRIDDFRKDQFTYRKGAYAYVMPKERSVDIDTEFDLRFAEFLMGGGGISLEDEGVSLK